MSLKVKISKAEHDALHDSLKTEYIPDGDGFKLDADYEDVTGLKAKRDELLQEQKRLKDAMKAFEGLDPEAARKALDSATAAEDERLKAAGEFDALRKQIEDRHKQQLEAATAEKATILTNLKREKLANALTEKGVLPDRVKYLLGELDAQIELASTDNGFQLKKINGIGDAAEFDAIIEGVKTSSPFFFAANNASGSGASGSDSNGGTTGKVMKREAFVSMSPAEQSAFSIGGGKLTD
jgi:hypothetical protein